MHDQHDIAFSAARGLPYLRYGLTDRLELYFQDWQHQDPVAGPRWTEHTTGLGPAFRYRPVSLLTLFGGTSVGRRWLSGADGGALTIVEVSGGASVHW